MRILVVGYFGDLTGHGRYCRAFAEGLASAGAEVDTHDVGDYLRPSYIRFAPARKVDRGIRAIHRATKVVAAVRSRRFDVVHFQIVTPIVDAWWLSTLLDSRRAAITVHNVVPHSPGIENWHGFQRRVFDAMSGIIVHTEQNRARFAEIFPEAAPKVRVIAHGVWRPDALPPRSEARRALGLPEDRPVVLFFGALRANKGLTRLLRALGILRARLGARAPVVLVAGKLPAGATFDRYRAVAAEAGVADDVVVRLGFVPDADVALHYAAADVVALPYDPTFEAQSGVLVDAYAYGVPVVSTDAAGLGATLGADGTGAVASDFSPEAFAEALQRLAESDAPRAAMSARMRELSERKYAWPAIGRQTLTMYRELLGAPA